MDVDTYRGTLEGVPALLDVCAEFAVKASFLFSVGPDNTGRAIRRVFKPGFLNKVGRTSVVSHYGIRTLLNGTVLPGPHIGKRAGHIMKRAIAEGHEVGIHCYDHVLWQDYVMNKDADWTRREMMRAWEAYLCACEVPPATIGAAGWQLNKFVLQLEEELGFRYASDVRGFYPFYPSMEGVRSNCVQIPTTLPTLDEILGVNGIEESNCWQHILELSHKPLPQGHVFTLHAELEGMKLLSTLTRLLKEWQSAGFQIQTLGDIFASLDPETLPQNSIIFSEVNGRSGKLAVQSR